MPQSSRRQQIETGEEEDRASRYLAPGDGRRGRGANPGEGVAIPAGSGAIPAGGGRIPAGARCGGHHGWGSPVSVKATACRPAASAPCRAAARRSGSPPPTAEASPSPWTCLLLSVQAGSRVGFCSLCGLVVPRGGIESVGEGIPRGWPAGQGSPEFAGILAGGGDEGKGWEEALGGG
jgi:hypothetical protein